MSELMNDIEEKVLNTNLSEISIYSIDRELRIGDIVYGYLTNPSKAKESVIIPQYPFKVISKSDNKLYLRGQKSLGLYTYGRLIDSYLYKFYAHFIHNGKVEVFDASVPTFNELNNMHYYIDPSEDLISCYWTLTSFNEEKAWCIDYLNRLHVEMKHYELNIIPFLSIPYNFEE